MAGLAAAAVRPIKQNSSARIGSSSRENRVVLANTRTNHQKQGRPEAAFKAPIYLRYRQGGAEGRCRNWQSDVGDANLAAGCLLGPCAVKQGL
ncbi:MAG TPA: hypothetical protein VE865_08820, partial [Bradyrhizobium sp.]|nr:hypothetical protein [Bradyrhizobium sp.]